MLKVFYGTDTVAVRQTAFDFVVEQEATDVTLTYIDSSSYVVGALADAVGATSLFGGSELFVIDTPSSNKDFDAEVKSSLEALTESNNVFVVIEENLLAAPKKQYTKYAESIVEFKGEKVERFNAFAMADALAEKDRKKLWVLLQEAKAAGLSAEEIIGTLWWQLKSMRLAAATGNAAEAGMKDFPYNKAKRALSKFKDDELEKTSRNLLSLYHDGHLGKRDIDLALEKWTLTL